MRAARAATGVLVACALGASAWAGQASAWTGSGMVVSADGRHLYAAGDSTAAFRRDPDSGGLTQLSAQEPGGSVVAMSPDQRHVYVGGESVLHVMSRDDASGLLTHQHTYLNGEDPRYALEAVSGILVTPDGGQVVITSRRSNAVFVFERDAATGLLTPLTSRAAPASGLAQAPDGSSLFAVGAQTLTVFRRDRASGTLGRGEAHPLRYDVTAVASTPDGRSVVVGGGNTNFEVFPRDPATGALAAPQTSRFDGSMGYGGLTAAPDGSLYGRAYGEPRVTHTRLTADGPTFVRRHEEADGVPGLHGPQGLALSPDGRSLYVTGSVRGYAGRPEIIPGTIVTFARDAATGDLRFARLLEPQSKSIDLRAPTPTLTVNDGALYTNDPRVTVTVTPAAGASLRITEAGGLSSPILRVTDDDRYPLTLMPGPAERSVRRVDAAFIRHSDSTPSPVSDDIILDQRPPVVISAEIAPLPQLPAAVALPARAAKRVLRLRARDARSGVVGLQITRDRRRPGRVRPYRSRTKLSVDRRRVYVRVRDGAGNASRWRAVKRAPAKRR